MEINNVVVTKKIKKIYLSGTEKVIALDNVNITIKKGDFVAIVGTSGSGKTTLMNILGGLDVPTSGEVLVNQKDIGKMNEEERTMFRRSNIGFVFQDYNLIPILTTYENIVLPLELERKTINEKYINKLLAVLNISEKKNCLPSQLSGGQQQRVAIARAVISSPALILADEPTGNLDSKTSLQVVNLLKDISEKFKQTVIMITHNEAIAKQCNYIIRIEDGKVDNNGGDEYEEK